MEGGRGRQGKKAPQTAKEWDGVYVKKWNVCVCVGGVGEASKASLS